MKVRVVVERIGETKMLTACKKEPGEEKLLAGTPTTAEANNSR